jgi:hypothetical protein
MTYLVDYELGRHPGRADLKLLAWIERDAAAQVRGE